MFLLNLIVVRVTYTRPSNHFVFASCIVDLDDTVLLIEIILKRLKTPVLKKVYLFVDGKMVAENSSREKFVAGRFVAET